MNIFGGLCIVAAFGLTSILAQSPQTNTSKIERFFYDRCRKYSSDGAVYDDIKTHFGQFSDFLTYAASLLPNGREQFCHDEKPKLTSLARALALEMKRCMHKDEKYLPGFIYNSFSEFLNFSCTGRNIDSFFSSQGSDCRARLKAGKAGEEVGDCFKKLFAGFQDIVKKDDLCLNLKSAKLCFGESLARHCGDFAAYESLNRRFFDAVMKPCTEPDSAVTIGISTVLLIIAFISTKIVS